MPKQETQKTPMRILVINPNTTPSMTAKIGLSAQAVASDTTEITTLSPDKGPASIEGFYDEAYCVPGVLETIRKGEIMGYDGYVIACFDDPGVDAAREIVTKPAIGICQAAMYAASMVSTSFSVVTTLPRSIPIIERLAQHYGMTHFCRRVRAAALPVLSLEDPHSNAIEQIKAEIYQALEQDRAESIILGCAGMSDLAQWLSCETGVPVIDGVGAAVKMVEALIGLGLKTSKVGAYGFPLPKPYQGDFAPNQWES